MRMRGRMKRGSIHREDSSEACRQVESKASKLGSDGLRRGPGWFGRRGRLGWILAACCLLQCTRPVQVGQQAPDFVLEDLRGGSVSLGGLRGKVVFLHFWATWCPPCLVELPALTRFVDQLNEGGFALLAVCVDNERSSTIKDFLQGWGTEIPVYLDPGGSLARRYGTVRFPETYILDHEGVVCRKVIGAGEWKTPNWAHILHACAGKAGADQSESDPGS